MNREDFRKNAKAFEEILGNPFAYPEPVPGQYYKAKYGSPSMRAIDISKDNKGSLNPAQPSNTDFVCDVDRVIRLVIREQVNNLAEFSTLYKRFIETYIYEEESLDEKERVKFEQRIGKLLRIRSISPLSKYFKTIRKRIGE